MTEIRKLLGFCPQHNVLFPELTVRDHLELFSVLKSSKADSRSIVRQVDKMIS
jgi:ATP-binding cassette, subfamily A (ABC1), member 3